MNVKYTLWRYMIMGFCLPFHSVVASDSKTTPSTRAFSVVNLPQSPIQQQSIRGRVLDQNGAPLANASIATKGKTYQTMTDAQGAFELQVDNLNTILVVNYVGFESREIQATASFMNITLTKKDAALEEVVVVGYGTTRKVNLTGAVSAVDGKTLENRPLVNLGQGLQGVVPNLVVTPGNSRPGRGAEFNIRGVTSINGGGPLILVDGVQMDVNLINPDDVESVSVLKDAASSAIYGARAAYGVILVTTKSGKRNRAPQISLKSNLVFNKPTLMPEAMTSLEYAEFMNMVNVNSGGAPSYNADVMERIRAFHDDPKNNSPVYFDNVGTNQRYQYVGNTNWVKETVRPFSVNQMYNVEISGGSDKTTYHTSFGVLDQGGLMKLTKDIYRRYNANVNVATQVTNWLEVSARARISHGKTDAPSGGKYYDYNSGLLGYDLSPLLPVYHPDGNYAGQGSITNAVSLAEQGGRTQVMTNDMWLTGATKITPIEGMSINADYTFNFYSRGYSRHDRSYRDYLAVPGVYVMFPHTNPNRITKFDNSDYYHAFNLYMDYVKEFGNHRIKGMVGYNQESKKYSGYGVSRSNLINNDLPYLGLATGTIDLYTLNVGSWNSNIPNDVPSGSDMIRNANQEWAIQGYFFRVNYDYKNRYLLELNGRYDGSSRFPSSGRWAFFPSVSAGWRIAEEKFMEGTRNVLDDLKFRVSYGELGNQNIGNFDYLPSMPTNTQFNYIFGTTRPVSVTAPSLVNPNFTWETVRQVNFGLDAALFRNRLEASFDYYNRYTLNMLTAPAPLPNVLGSAQPQANAADLKTYGWELSLKWQDQLQKSGLHYNVGVVLADNQTRITKYDIANPGYNSYYPGKMLGEIWGYHSDGYFSTDAEAAAVNQSYLYGGAWFAGDRRYKDLNGDGRVNNGSGTVEDPGDVRRIGNSTPRYHYGVTGGLNYKGIGFNLFLQGIAKRQVAPETNYHGARREYTPFRSALDYWTPDNPNARLARQSYNNGNRSTQTAILQNAAYMRLKSLTVSYDLPAHWIAAVKMNRARLYFTGENLLTFTKLWRDYDPEQATSIYSYPLARMYSFGLNVSF